VSWLHISDLHFRRPNYEADIVLQDLIKDVEKQIRDQDFQLDFIVVTGDVAFRSVPSEYGRAAEFFDQLLAQSGIEKDRLFIVPGNHDVHWTTIKNQGDFPEECVKACGTIAGVNRFLGSTQNLRRVLSKFQHYRRFIKEYFTEDNIMFQSLDNRQLFFVAPIEAGGKRVNLIGLNSAWMSAYNWKPRQYLNKADDERNLIVGERQLRDALNEVDEQQNDIIIAAMHHPIDWLNPYERERIGGLLPRNCNMLLHGHLHQSGIVGHTGPSGKITTIAAGASYLNVEESLSYTGYNFVQLNPDNDQGTIYMRRYSKRHGGFWTTDTSYPDMPDGLYPFTL
jgi:predicted MPP superfamily phosphohydrolase